MIRIASPFTFDLRPRRSWLSFIRNSLEDHRRQQKFNTVLEEYPEYLLRDMGLHDHPQRLSQKLHRRDHY